MIILRTFSIEKDDTTKDLEKRPLDADAARAAIIACIDHRGARRSFMDISKPGVILLAYADDSEGRIDCHALEGSEEEIRPLRLFALQYKSEQKRKENVVNDLAKPSQN